MLLEQERRAFARLAIDCTVVFKEPQNHTASYGSGKNLSGNGILFETNDTISVGTHIEIDVVPTLEQFKPLNAMAEVVRVDSDNQHAPYLVAATLTRILS